LPFRQGEPKLTHGSKPSPIWESLPIQDKPEKLGQLVYDWDMRLIMNDGNVQTTE